MMIPPPQAQLAFVPPAARKIIKLPATIRTGHPIPRQHHDQDGRIGEGFLEPRSELVALIDPFNIPPDTGTLRAMMDECVKDLPCRKDTKPFDPGMSGFATSSSRA